MGISLGIQDDFEVLAEQIDQGLEQGYQRIKLKIEPGKDVSVVEPVRLRFGDIPLMVDANCGYRNDPNALDSLKALDGFGLLMIEQPLAHDDIDGHAPCRPGSRPPSASTSRSTRARHAAHAIDIEACRLINIKASRIGGRAAAIAIHDLCAARDIPVWCGGMLESGIGRLHNIALASLPNFQMPGDLSVGGYRRRRARRRAQHRRAGARGDRRPSPGEPGPLPAVLAVDRQLNGHPRLLAWSRSSLSARIV